MSRSTSVSYGYRVCRHFESKCLVTGECTLFPLALEIHAGLDRLLALHLVDFQPIPSTRLPVAARPPKHAGLPSQKYGMLSCCTPGRGALTLCCVNVYTPFMNRDRRSSQFITSAPSDGGTDMRLPVSLSSIPSPPTLSWNKSVIRPRSVWSHTLIHRPVPFYILARGNGLARNATSAFRNTLRNKHLADPILLR